MTNFHDVRKFHQHFDLPVGDHPQTLLTKDMGRRILFMQEELDEIISSAGVYMYAEEQGQVLPPAKYLELMAGIFDGLLDLTWVAMGTAVMMGMPWEEGWALIREANMAKVRVPTEEGHKWGVGKPEGWQAPDHVLLILQQIDTIRRMKDVCHERGLVYHAFCDHGMHVTEACVECENQRILGTIPSRRGTKFQPGTMTQSENFLLQSEAAARMDPDQMIEQAPDETMGDA